MKTKKGTTNSQVFFFSRKIAYLTKTLMRQPVGITLKDARRKEFLKTRQEYDFLLNRQKQFNSLGNLRIENYLREVTGAKCAYP